MLCDDKKAVKSVYQGVDFLVLGIKITNESIFKDKFTKFKDKLDFLKRSAMAINTYGEKFVADDLGIKNARFLISSKGIENYTYVFHNNDIYVSVSNAAFESPSKYHLKVQFRSEFLVRMGEKKAYKLVKAMLDKILFYNCYEVKILRVDLCSDIVGVVYTPNDIYNFRSLRKATNYKQDINYYKESPKTNKHGIKFVNYDETPNTEYVRFMRFQGISFGKAPAMFRIYDKIQEITQKQGSILITKRWEKMGVDIKKDKIFRHECEFTRDFIKKIIPYNCKDEIKYLFDNLGKFWAVGVMLVKWYDLTQSEISRLIRYSVARKSANKRKIYQRVNDDETRFHFWDIVSRWHNEFYILHKHKIPNMPNLKVAKNQLKGLVSVVYKNLGNTNAFKFVLDEVKKDLANQYQCTLHEYALNKVCSSFIDNSTLFNESEVLKTENIDRYELHLIDIMLSLDSLINETFKDNYKKSLQIYESA